MRRSFETEILEREGVPAHLRTRAYRDLTSIHRVLGDTRSIVSAIRTDPLPVRRVLDVGCGHGGVLKQVRDSLAIDAIGVDLNPPPHEETPIPILQANAIRDPLPPARHSVFDVPRPPPQG